MEALKKQIIETLEAAGFQVDMENVSWRKQETHMTGGATISINGQVMHQPGGTIEIKQCIYFTGEGWIANEDETDKQEFTQIKFETYQGDDLTMQFEEAFYWDNPNYFIEFFNQVFNN